MAYAQKAKERGASRFCMAAAWREVRDNRDFDRIIDMVKGERSGVGSLLYLGNA